MLRGLFDGHKSQAANTTAAAWTFYRAIWKPDFQDHLDLCKEIEYFCIELDPNCIVLDAESIAMVGLILGDSYVAIPPEI